MQKDYTNKEKSQSEDGTEPCKKCDGIGWVPMIPDDPDCDYIKRCPLCGGEGVVDWIRKIMGYSPQPTTTEQSWPKTNVKAAVTNFKIPKGVVKE